MASGADRLATLLTQVANGHLSGEDALRLMDSEQFDRADWRSRRFEDAYHLLQHFAADEDIRETDPTYAKRQRASLEKMAQRLRE